MVFLLQACKLSWRSHQKDKNNNNYREFKHSHRKNVTQKDLNKENKLKKKIQRLKFEMLTFGGEPEFKRGQVRLLASPLTFDCNSFELKK